MKKDDTALTLLGLFAVAMIMGGGFFSLQSIWQESKSLSECENFRVYWQSHIVSQPNLGGQYEHYCMECGQCNPVMQGDNVEYYNLRCVSSQANTDYCSSIIDSCTVYDGYDDEINFDYRTYKTISCPSVTIEESSINTESVDIVNKSSNFVDSIINAISSLFNKIINLIGGL